MHYTRWRSVFYLALAFGFVGTSPTGFAQTALPPQPPAPTDVSAGDAIRTGDAEAETEGDYDVLMQGPVHEAFAAPVDTDFTDGVRLYAKAPPQRVNEQAPETPSDEAMKWIPGYFSWDDDADDYVWVSGLWRKVPPGRTWTPGAWSQVGSGYRWNSGFWSGATAANAASNQLPMPPKSIDNGPSVAPPSEDYFWVPGHWDYAGNAYAWRSGFWGQQQNDWVWQPACYVSTGQGYVMIDGYWDYLPTSRGQLYAPVRFYDSIYNRPNYIYRPRYPLANAGSLLLRLFVRSGYPNYYYGDFYGPSYQNQGYRAWYDLGRGSGYGYQSPLLGYYDWKYRKSGIDFARSMSRYEQHERSNGGQSSPKFASGQLSPKYASGKQPLAGGPPFDRSMAIKNDKHSRSFDDVVRSDVARVSTPGGDQAFKGKSPKGFGNANPHSFNNPVAGGRSAIPRGPEFGQGQGSQGQGGQGQGGQGQGGHGQGRPPSPPNKSWMPSTGSQAFQTDKSKHGDSKPFRSSGPTSFDSPPMIQQRSSSSNGRPAEFSDRGAAPRQHGNSPAFKTDRGGGSGFSGGGNSKGNQKPAKSGGGGKGKK